MKIWALFVSSCLFMILGTTSGYNQSHSWCLQKHYTALFTQIYDCYENVEHALNDRVPSRGMAVGSIFLLQAVIGTLGNFILLSHYFFHYHKDTRMRTTDLILIHLTISNFFFVLSKGVYKAMTEFELEHLLSDIGCKIVLYVFRVSRSISVSTTCLLSVFQTIMISPMNSCWKELKVKARKYVGSFLLFCWVLYTLFSLIFPMYVPQGSDSWKGKDTVKQGGLGNCSSVHYEKIIASVYTVFTFFLEVLLYVLIIWASVSMILILFQHRKQIHYLHRTSLSVKSSAESRATQSILCLLSTFVCFHTLTTIFYFCLTHLHNPSIWLVTITEISSSCFPTVCPFLFISRDSTVSKVSLLWLRNRKSHDPSRKQ